MANIYQLNIPSYDEIDFRGMAGINYFCPNCGTPLMGKKFIPSGLNINRKGKDIFNSYEGKLLVSAKAKRLLGKHVSSKIEFYSINKDDDVYLVDLSETVEFDAKRAQVKFIKPCRKCSYYEEVICPAPAFIKNIDDINPYGMYFTDLWFASFDYKHPIVILGEKIFQILAENFPEIYEEKAYGPDDVFTLPNGETM